MRFLLGVLMLMISGSALATIDVLQFKDEAQEQQFRQLTEELRCPKCQNNSIADSNSMIATDLRQKVYELMQEGKSKKEIVDYMVARYGNFVTYDPPLTPLTMLLWVLPVVAIGIGGWVIYARSRRRVRVVPDAFPEQSVPEGKRAGYIVYLPGIVVALIVAGVSYYQTGNYQQVKIWQQATAQAPALLDRALDPKADPLNEEEIRKIVIVQLNSVKKMLAQNGIALEFTDAALTFISDKGFDPQFGARPVKRVIQKYVLNELSKELLGGKINKDRPITIDSNGAGLVFKN